MFCTIDDALGYIDFTIKMATTAKRSGRIKSEVWKYFKRVKDRAQCSLCLRWLKFSGNTTNFKLHLQNVHNKLKDDVQLNEATELSTGWNLETCSDCSRPRLHSSLNVCSSSSSLTVENLVSPSPDLSAIDNRVEQPTISEAFQLVKRFAPDGSKTQVIQRALLLWLVKDNRPPELLAGEGFKYFMKTVWPRFQVPHPSTIKRNIEHLYDNAVNYLRLQFADFNYCALTMDVWTDASNTRSYMGTTLHYIQNYELKTYVLGMALLQESHTNRYLSEQLESLIEFWELDKSKIIACVSDSGSNIVAGIEGFIGSQKQVSCFAHKLNLVVKDAVKAVPVLKEIIAKVKSIATFFRRSNNAASALVKEQQKKGAEPLKLKPGGIVFILCVEIREYITLALQTVVGPDMISGNEIRIIFDALKILKPFLQVTLEVSAEKNCTISKVILLATLLSTCMLKIKPETDVGSLLIGQCRKNLDIRFKTIEANLIFSIATVLDPRFKRNDFRSVSCCAAAVNHINSELSKTCVLPSGMDGQCCNTVLDEDDLWSLHSITMSNSVNQNTSNSHVISFNSGFRNYLQTGLLPHTTDPLKVWKEWESVYPQLTDLAVKHLTVPASSVPAERVFSKAGEMLARKRNSIKPKRVKQLIILSSLSIQELSML